MFDVALLIEANAAANSDLVKDFLKGLIRQVVRKKVILLNKISTEYKAGDRLWWFWWGNITLFWPEPKTSFLISVNHLISVFLHLYKARILTLMKMVQGFASSATLRTGQRDYIDLETLARL